MSGAEFRSISKAFSIVITSVASADLGLSFLVQRNTNSVGTEILG